MIKPYLSNIINDHKIPKKLRVHSSNEVIDYETQYEDQEIQLRMLINLISSEGPGTRIHFFEIFLKFN